MSKLLILAAVCVLAAPAAFAQPAYPSPRDPPAYAPAYDSGDRYSWDGDSAYPSDRERHAWARRHGHARMYRAYGDYDLPGEAVANRPVRDTPQNRRRYPPLSYTGARTAADGR